MGLIPKPNSNPRLVEPINRGFRPHFRHIQHLQNSELRLQEASNYQVRRIRNCKASERSQPPTDQEQGAFRILQLILHPSRSSGHALESLNSSGD